MPTRRKILTRARRQRLRDFEHRRNADDGNPPALNGYECVLVHPLADESERLARLNYAAEKCTSVDAYWRLGYDVVFLQVSTPWPGGPEPGLYAQRDDADGRLTLTAILSSQTLVDSTTFALVMKRFSDLRWNGAELIHANISASGVRFGEL